MKHATFSLPKHSAAATQPTVAGPLSLSLDEMRARVDTARSGPGREMLEAFRDLPHDGEPEILEPEGGPRPRPR